MSNRPWMPFYVADYLGDTGHLRTVDHGAYLLLIMHYWRTGGLPDDNVKLAKITRLPLKSWTEQVRPIIEPLFRPGWKHKRIDKELQKHAEIAAKRAAAGQKGGLINSVARKEFKANRLRSMGSWEANAKQMDSNHSHISKKEAAEMEFAVSSELEAKIRSELK